MTRILTMGLAGLLIAGSAGRGQAAAAGGADAGPPTYVDENSPDPAPLKLREVDGVVRGLGGDPVTRASVSLFTEQGHQLISTVMSDKDGKFRFDKLDKGPYRVVVKVAGLCPANVPILLEGGLLAARRLIITMQAKDIDTCSYGMAKR
jgi:hypothetical protein